MASVTKEKIPEVAEFMTDFWNMIKEFYEPEAEDEWWDRLLDEGNRIAGKASNKLCIDLVVTYIRFLEKKHKGSV